MKKALLLSALLTSGLSYGQVTNSTLLNHNNISALISDEGMFFNNPQLGIAGYEIPKGSGKNSIYAMAPWVGAVDINGQLHLSANAYGASSFHSGPIADPAHYGTASYTNQYSSAIWSVTANEIADHINNSSLLGYVTPQSILDWPGNGDVSMGVAAQLAPYVDQNSNGVYDPVNGDYPEIRGDEAVYVIMNDASFNPDGNELKMEIHIMFYQYASANYLNNTMFMNVQTFNRSTTSYYDYKQSFYVDFDLGNYADDYIGCDTINDVAFVYNGDDLDENSGGNNGYGVDPPCQGLTSISHKMESFNYYSSASSYPYSDPIGDVEIWNIMNAMYSNGTPWVIEGTNIPTNHIYPGNPNDPNSWSEQNTNGLGFANPPGDRRIIMTIGEDEFLSGSSICSDYAFIYSKSGDRLANVQEVLNIAGALRNWYDLDNGDFLCSGSAYTYLSEVEAVEFTLYPNPSNGSLTVSLPNNEDEVLVEVLDMTGRKVFTGNYFNTSEIQINLNESPGIYLVKTEINAHSSIKRLILE